MIPYEQFFFIIIVSILGPIVSLFVLISNQLKEAEVNLLETQNNRILLEKELETVKYYQLSQQIQPHFLFNALNSLLSLLKLKKYDVLNEGFEHMVLFLRYKYDVNDNVYPLSEEIKYTNHYLEIQKLRFGSRLTVAFDVDDDLMDELTIPFLLQTLVENAFKHGIEETEGQSQLNISITSDDYDQVKMKVVDNGPGFPSVDHVQLRTGLQNIVDRLQLIYGEKAILALENNLAGKGAVVSVSWPKGEKQNRG